MSNNFVDFDKLVVGNISVVSLVTLAKGTPSRTISRGSNALSIKLGGLSVYKVNGKTEISDPNNIMILAEGSGYSFEVKEYGECILINFSLEKGKLFTSSFPISETDEAFILANRAKEIFLEQDNGWQLAIKGIIYQLFAIMKTGREKSKKKNLILDKAMAYIDENIASSSLKNEDVASFCGMSEVYLRFLFKKYLKTSPHAYLIKKRIEKARIELVSTDKKISVISEDVGFQDVYHFSKSFKKSEGVSPNKYRQANSFLN